MGNSKLKLSLMQPTFNPWLGYFDMIDYVDLFIFYDNIQLNQQSWQTRNKLLLQKKEFLFSLPIKKNKSKNQLLIKDTRFDFDKYDFREKLFKTLNQNYSKAKYFKEVNPFIEELVFFDTNFLSQYTINIIKKICQKIEIKTKIIILSETKYKKISSKGDEVLNICKYFNTSDYISPLGSKEYLEKVSDKFKKENINIYYQYYKHPTYNQLGKNFIPYIGIFDLLYNEGFENSLKIIRSGRKYEK